MLTYPFVFPKISGRLVRRLNRFVVEVEIDGRLEEAYLANPGRLWELFLPGTELLLSPVLSGGRLPYTVLACRIDGRYVLLHTHLTNKVVHRLIIEDQLTLFRGYRVVKEEPAYGRHRFDLLLEHKTSGESYYLEIKSCTLFSGQIAMFPDAVTKRGSEHLRKLKELADGGIKTGCLFVVMNPGADFFLPAYHIDHLFTESFLAVKDAVQLNAVALGFDDSFTAVESIKPLVIPVDLLETEFEDRGAYLLLVRIDCGKTLGVGSLGQIEFKQGYYVYVGSAMRGLAKRVARHIRKKKNIRWHIDYLTAAAEKVSAVPIISSENLECQLANRLEKITGSPAVQNFGSSDCRCPGHLFYFAENPLHHPGFIDLIQYFRIERLNIGRQLM
jgi:sugar fermentation stimulation protein A